MSKIIDNKVEFDINVDSSKQNYISQPIINKYNPFKIKKINKKCSFSSMIIILLEISLILFAFLLTLQKAIKTIVKNNDIKEYTNITRVKRKIYSNDRKLCLCTVGKNDNIYIKEFVQFYEKWGVDKIFLYDNNDLKGENFGDIINDYVNEGLVEVIDYRGKNENIINMLDNCYQKNYEKYDWFAFFGIGEFIHLKNYTNIKEFLNEQKFNNCQKIYLNLVFHTDKDLYHYDNKSLQEKFPIKEDILKKKPYNFVKTIIKGHISNVKIESLNYLTQNIGGCNSNCRKTGLKSFIKDVQDFENYYIIHYSFKSTAKFWEKL
jgi:hypothetical protein